MTADDLTSLKRQLTHWQTEVNKLEGAEAALNKRLLDDFGCGSIEEAKSLIDKLTSKLARRTKRLRKLERLFKKRWNARENPNGSGTD